MKPGDFWYYKWSRDDRSVPLWKMAVLAGGLWHYSLLSSHSPLSSPTPFPDNSQSSTGNLPSTESDRIAPWRSVQSTDRQQLSRVHGRNLSLHLLPDPCNYKCQGLNLVPFACWVVCRLTMPQPLPTEIQQAVQYAIKVFTQTLER